MTVSRVRPLALFAVASVFGLGQAAAHTDTEVLEANERLLTGDELPAWRTLEERQREASRPRPPALHRLEDRLLPPPPRPGYRVPAEFEPVAALLVTQGDWGKNSMFVDILRGGTSPGGARAIALTRDDAEDFALELASRGVDTAHVSVVASPEGLNTKWIRDFGPISIYEPWETGASKQEKLGLVDLHYYDFREQDDAVPELLAQVLGLSRHGLEGDAHLPPDARKLYLEGGNYQTDGQGTCVLSNDIPGDNGKNPDADTFEEVEDMMAQFLGCEQILWLRPAPNSGTGHVDLYAKLLSPTDVLMIDFPNSKDNNLEADAVIEENVALMERATNLAGQPFDIHRVTLPPLGAGPEGWIYKTYTNSVILNHVVLVPTYDAPLYDSEALEVYAEVLGPDYEIIGIPSSSIIAQGGAVHCTTMQIASVCGNGRLDPMLEDCDGEDLAGQTCQSLGLPEGRVECGADCRFDTRPCGRPPDEERPASDTAGASWDSDDTGAKSPPLSARSETGSGCNVKAVPPRSRQSLDILIHLVL